jgi:glucokinase
MRQAGFSGDWQAADAVPKRVIGIEIGGRGQRVVVADASGKVLGQAHSIDSSAPAEVVVENLEGLVDQACDHAGLTMSEISRAGIAFGGPVDVRRGTTIISHRAPGYENFPLVNLVEERIGVPTEIENDARAAALGEAMYGAARGSRDLVYVHLGTGVGAGIIVDGRFVRGPSGTAGEIGHMVVSIGGPVCSCGKPGHLEAYAAGPSILGRFRSELSTRGTPEETARWSASRSITVRNVFEDSARHEGVARQIVSETIQVLGVAIANLITVLNPGVVVIGGSVSEAGQALLDPLGARVRQYSYPAALRHVRISRSQLGADANVIGAASLAISASDE